MYISGDTPKFARKLMFSGQKKPIQPLFPADGHMAELWDVAVGPNRERECLVGERARIANRMKATLARLGIRNFKPTLRKAAERLATLHTPEGSALPPNALAELQREIARLGFVTRQIKEIEEARQKRLEQEPETEPHAMVRHLA